MRAAYIDAFSGAAGDMFAGALLDAGCPEGELRGILSKLPLDEFQVEIRRERRGAFVGTRFLVHTRPSHAHRRIGDIFDILDRARLPERVLSKAKEVFVRIARAEGAAHGMPEQDVHFHEVGAVDTIVDIVASCAGFYLLGIEEASCSPIELGSGFVNCEHGKIPVPAPGTMGILLGMPVRVGGLMGERTTPTGAAILATFVNAPGEPAELVPRSVGYGAGGRETPDVPNLLRIIVGDAEIEGDRVAVLEANLDDTNGETLAFVIEQALACGALDAFVTPATMKKGRPGFVVTVLSPLERRLELENLLFRETPTLGVRRYVATRSKLHREVREFTTPLGAARVKLRWLPGGEVDLSAEFDDAKKIAIERKISLANAVAAIESAARAQIEQKGRWPETKAVEQKHHSHGDHKHSHGGHHHDHHHH